MIRRRAALTLFVVVLAFATTAHGREGVAGNDLAPVHLLSRTAFGPRPGDVARVKQMGAAAWLEQQLHPERIDDSACDAALQGLATLRMPITDLLSEYPRPDPRVREQMQSGEMTRRELMER